VRKAKKADQIAAELQQTRSRLLDSVERLEDQLSPGRLAQRGASVVLDTFSRVKSQLSVDALLGLFGRR
jgi:hypothetical protein